MSNLRLVAVFVVAFVAACNSDSALSLDGGIDLAVSSDTSVASDVGGLDAADPNQLCVATGGKVETALCCMSSAAFPNSCLVGACGCAPDFSQPVAVCSCPMNGCFVPSRGCVMAVCEPGADQTCNESPTVSAIYGRCQSDRTCTCLAPRTLNPATGKCR